MTDITKKDIVSIGQAKEALAEQLGIEPDDIKDEDSMTDDLHMRPSDITDYIQALNNKGVNVVDLDLTEITTLTDLFEKLNLEE